MDLNILKFNTKNNEYIFDGNSSKIFVQDKYFKHIIKSFENNVDYLEIIEQGVTLGLDKKSLENKYIYINKLIENGYLKKSTKSNPKFDIEQEIYNTPNMALILVLTGNCNLRCKYCVYGEHYPGEITYEDIKVMSFDIAKKAIDEFIGLYNDKVKHGFFKEPSIFFYGGEPLLEKNLIKKIVDYTKEVNFHCNFYMTTNGVLLDEDFSEFCVKNNFIITFSLDGYKSNHDRNRVSIKSSPTFDLIFKNILDYEKIKRKYGNNKLTSFNCCYDEYTDLEKCVDFFIENEKNFDPMYVVYSYISPYETDYHEWVDKNNIEEKALRSSLKKIYEKFANGYYSDNASKAATQNLFLGLMSLETRNTDIERPALNNCCIPLTKLAVYPDGNYTICERMNKKMPIGNVQNGIDYFKIQSISEKMIDNFYKGNCKDCVLKNLCNACFQFVDEDCMIKDEFCKNEKKSIKNRLVDYCTILEKNPLAFEKSNLLKEESELLNILG